MSKKDEKRQLALEVDPTASPDRAGMLYASMTDVRGFAISPNGTAIGLGGPRPAVTVATPSPEEPPSSPESFARMRQMLAELEDGPRRPWTSSSPAVSREKPVDVPRAIVFDAAVVTAADGQAGRKTTRRRGRIAATAAVVLLVGALVVAGLAVVGGPRTAMSTPHVPPAEVVASVFAAPVTPSEGPAPTAAPTHAAVPPLPSNTRESIARPVAPRREGTPSAPMRPQRLAEAPIALPATATSVPSKSGSKLHDLDKFELPARDLSE